MLPSFAARPQRGGTAPCDERALFTAVVYALTSGCAWRHLPPTFGTSPATAHRRFTVGTEAGLWRRLHRAVLDELGARGEVNWTSAIVDAASVRAKRGIADRAEPARSRQEGQQAARAGRLPRPGLGCARQQPPRPLLVPTRRGPAQERRVPRAAPLGAVPVRRQVRDRDPPRPWHLATTRMRPVVRAAAAAVQVRARGDPSPMARFPPSHLPSVVQGTGHRTRGNRCAGVRDAVRATTIQGENTGRSPGTQRSGPRRDIRRCTP
ncbi:transposase [Streptomyces bobili]|uniref:transposase n=1 Tax=Streptomyces bobili TaxID=67280 RepID=UPI003F5415FE